MLKLSPDLSLPRDAVTQTFAFLAKRRVGKSYTIAVMAEEMVKAHLPFVMIDPTGAHWGLRASADGKGPGLPVVVIGGAHGDLPLDPETGDSIADLVVDHPGFYVLDLSLTKSNAEQDRFCTAFAERLYRRKQSARDPLHVFIDEADMVLPQRPQPNQLRMLGAFEALVRRGGIYGIGVSVVSQRPAICNKNVLSQVEVLVALQTTGPHDRKAIKEWAEGNGTKAQADELMASLASLGKGEAWFWSPSWLEVFKKVKIRARHTFNSSATPKAGERTVEPKKLADVDLATLRAKLAATIEKAKADDPRALRAEVAKLKAELLSAQRHPVPVNAVKEKRVEVPVLKEAQIKRLESVVAKARQVADVLRAAAASVEGLVSDAKGRTESGRSLLINGTASVKGPLVRRHLGVSARVWPTPPMSHVTQAPSPSNGSATNGVLLAGERRMLEVLARRFPVRLTKNQLGTLCGLTPSAGTFGNYFGRLKREGYLLVEVSGLIELTPKGARESPIPPGARPQTTEEVLEMWRARLLSGERRLLDELVRTYPKALSKEELASATGLTASAGTFGNYLGTLRRNGLAEVTRDGVCAGGALMLGAA